MPPTQATAPGPCSRLIRASSAAAAENRLVPGDFPAAEARPAGPLRVIGIGKGVTAPVADEIAVHRVVGPALQAHHFPVFGAAHGVAAQGAVEAQGRAPLKIPPPALEPGGLIGEHPGGADIDEIAGKGAFQGPVAKSAEIGAAADLQRPQVPVAGIVLVEAAAAPALDAAVHFVLHEPAQVLVLVGALGAQEAPDAVAAGDGFVLEQAVPPFVAHRAVQGVVQHEPFDDVFPVIHGVRVGG